MHMNRGVAVPPPSTSPNPRVTEKRLDEPELTAMLDALRNPHAITRTALQHTEEVLRDAFEQLFLLLINQPTSSEYKALLTYSGSWKDILSQLTPPAGEASLSPSNQFEAFDQLSKANFTASENPSVLYPLLSQEEISALCKQQNTQEQEAQLTQEMISRQYFRDTLTHRFENRAEPKKPASTTYTDNAYCSPIVIALLHDILSTIGFPQDHYPGKDSNLSDEKIVDEKCRINTKIKEAIEETYTDLGIPENLQTKISALYRLHRVLGRESMPIDQKVNFIKGTSRDNQLSRAELSGFITALNYHFGSVIFTDEMFEQLSASNDGVIHEHLMLYLTTIDGKTFFNSGLSAKEPEDVSELDFLAPFYSKLKKRLKSLPNTVSANINEASMAQEHPAHLLIAVLLQSLGNKEIDTETFQEQVRQGVDTYLYKTLLPQLTRLRMQWTDALLSEKHSVSELNFDLAVQAIDLLSSHTFRNALDTKTQASLFGSWANPKPIRNTNTSALTPDELRLLKDHRSLDEECISVNGYELIREIIKRTTSTILTKAGRQQMGLLDAFDIKYPYIQTIIGQRVAYVTQEFFIDLIPISLRASEPGINYNEDLNVLKKLLVHAIAIPEEFANHISPNRGLQQASEELCQRVFLLPRPYPTFFFDIHRVYRNIAKQFVDEMVKNLQSLFGEQCKMENWVIAILSCFSPDCIHRNIRQTDPEHKAFVLYQCVRKILDILCAPGGATFVSKREDSDTWSSHESSHFQAGIDAFLAEVRKKVTIEKISLETQLLFPESISHIASPGRLDNTNIGMVAAICSPIVSAVRHELETRDTELGPIMPESIRFTLRYLFHRPSMEKGNTYQVDKPMVEMLWNNYTSNKHLVEDSADARFKHTMQELLSFFDMLDYDDLSKQGLLGTLEKVYITVTDHFRSFTQITGLEKKKPQISPGMSTITAKELGSSLLQKQNHKQTAYLSFSELKAYAERRGGMSPKEEKTRKFMESLYRHPDRYLTKAEMYGTPKLKP